MADIELIVSAGYLRAGDKIKAGPLGAWAAITAVTSNGAWITVTASDDNFTFHVDDRVPCVRA